MSAGNDPSLYGIVYVGGFENMAMLLCLVWQSSRILIRIIAERLKIPSKQGSFCYGDF